MYNTRAAKGIPVMSTAAARSGDKAQPLLSEAIYEDILGRLVSGQLRPGSHLVEPQVAAELGCSRTPLRSALTRLVSEGLLEQRSHRGCFVAQPDAAQLREVYQVRAATEGLAAGLLAGRATLEELQALERLCQALEDARARLDMPAYNRQDFRFHRFVVRACGNRCLTHVSHAGALVLLSFLIPAYYEPLSATTPWPAPEPRDGHWAIYEAIAGRDVTGAESAMRDHIQAAAAAVAPLFAVGPREGVSPPRVRLGSAI